MSGLRIRPVRPLLRSNRLLPRIDDVDVFVTGQDENFGWGFHVVDVLVARTVLPFPKNGKVFDNLRRSCLIEFPHDMDRLELDISCTRLNTEFVDDTVMVEARSAVLGRVQQCSVKLIEAVAIHGHEHDVIAVVKLGHAVDAKDAHNFV